MRWKVRSRWALVALFSLVVAACGDDDGGGGAAADGDLSGTEVSVLGAFVEAEADNFAASLADFEARTGIEVTYEGTKDFNELINVRVEAGDAPDIAMLPQPGLLQALATDGHLVGLGGTEVETAINANYLESAADVGRGTDGELYGVWYKAAVKSLVWYPSAAFEAAGYEVPATWDDLVALSDRILADGTTPWCIGIESGDATGWVATDWVEDLMLRLHGPDIYDQWWQHELAFDDAKVVEAVDAMRSVWLKDGYVDGGPTNILTLPFGDAPRPLFDDEPGCFLHRQANFITDFFPDGSTVGPDGDVNFFPLPPVDPAEGERPTLVGGDIAVMFDDRPEVRAVMEFLATPESGVAWAKSGGYLSPHKTFDVSEYGDDTTREVGRLLTEADVVRYDASDLMPAEVGAGSFWSAMVDVVQGKDTKAALTAVERSWPT